MNQNSGQPGSGGGDAPFVHRRRTGVDETFRLAVQHEAAGRLQQAEVALRQILSQYPRHAGALHQLGLLAYRVGRLDAALEFVGKAVSCAPDEARFLANHTELCRLAGRLDEAIASGRRAVELAPDSVNAHSNLGIALYDHGDLDAAEAHQRRALALKPGLAPALNNLGSIHRARGDLDAAMDFFRQAIESDPNFIDSLNNLGSVLVLADRAAEAVAPLTRALELNRNFADACCNLGFAYQALNRIEEARPLFQRALELRPEYGEAHQGLARIFIETEQYPLAEQAARAAVRHAPENAEIHVTLGQVLAFTGHAADAHASYDRALELEPELASALVGKGILTMEHGDMDGAESFFHRALASGKDEYSARYYLTQIRRVEPGDTNLAELRAVVDQGDRLPEHRLKYLHFALGKALEDIGEYDDAFAHFLAGCRLRRAHAGYDEADRMRVFDGITAAFDRARIDALRGHGNPSTVPIFVLGMPRSGTTLTEQILACHPQVHGAGELYDLMHVASRSTIAPSGTRSYAENFFDLAPEHLREWSGLYLDGLTSFAPDAPHVTDKMPANFFLLGLIHLMLPNARVVHVQRNPLDTCLSCFTRLFQSGQDHTYDLAELGRYYRRYLELMAHWRAVLPAGAFLDLSYEQLVANPDDEVQRLVDFCGLPWDDACLEPHKHTRRVRTASVTQVRQPVYTSSVDRWRRYERHLGPLIDALGDAVDVA
ncbi:MAG: tetratricopeptide repeat-containing sulfotransferase family protein [Gammaproteobacteria bacterium]